jgi:hypothetical protein
VSKRAHDPEEERAMPTLELLPVVRENGLPTVQWRVVVDGAGLGIVTDAVFGYRVELSKGSRKYDSPKKAANALLRDCGIKAKF